MGRHHRLPKQIEPTRNGYQPTKLEPNPFIGLDCIKFLQGFARLHVALATCNRVVRNRHHRPSAVPAHRMNIRTSRSDEPFGLRGENAWTDRQTDIHTNIGRLHFSSNPPEEFVERKVSNANALDFERIGYSPISN